MEPKICVNESCGTKLAHEWRKGWPLPSGQFVDLCEKCGSTYDNSTFCETFHYEESGWRECKICDRRIHCGCIVSMSLFEVLDHGGIRCTGCPKSTQIHTLPSTVNRGEDEGKSMHLYKFTDSGVSPQSCISEPHALSIKVNQDLVRLIEETGSNLSNVARSSFGLLSKEDHIRFQQKLKELNISPPHTSLNVNLEDLIGGSNFTMPFATGHLEGSETNSETPSFQQGASSRPILPSLSKPGSAAGAGTSKVTVPQVRVARPPAEGRGKNQLLPRYWPRITDQELQQLSGDLNSTVVPLFEKVLSASDAGRIGRLVLPKACAEAYFPPISQSEGVPVRIQDVKGNEWTFQFRFWPNNNSRMYVLEGVTPCIQSLQLRAGDTVTFSRINPGGKLVMGFRKAPHPLEPQVNGTSARTPSRAIMGNIPAVSGFADVLNAVNGIKDSLPSSLFQNLKDAEGDISWHRGRDNVSGTYEDATQLPPISEKKKTRNIGSKSRRLLMHNEDVRELRLTWEEAQDLLRPPLNVNPRIVTIEGHDFEEYDEPPVFGKRTVYRRRSSGDLEQWAQCDDCSKWRRLPFEVVLPPKWACRDNVWDSERRICSAPSEMTAKELDGLLRVSKDTKKRRLVDDQCSAINNEIYGLDALASAAVLGESIVELVGPGEMSVGPTTKHPRHRAGCSCIVCIQPPSGKGRHRPTCTCNVCMTVKRRFKTLMLRKRKQHQQSEDEQQADGATPAFKTKHRDLESLQPTDAASLIGRSEDREAAADAASENGSSNGQIDLNCDPDTREMEGLDGEARGRADNIINSLSTSGTFLPDTDDYPTTITMSRSLQQQLQGQVLGCQSSNMLRLCQVEAEAATGNERHPTPPPNDEEAVASIAQNGKSANNDGDDDAAAVDLDPPCILSSPDKN